MLDYILVCRHIEKGSKTLAYIAVKVKVKVSVKLLSCLKTVDERVYTAVCILDLGTR